MNMTLAYLRGRRTWLVQGFAVWGSDYDAEFLMAAAEKVASDTRLGFWRVSLGGQAQEVSFSSLVDNRGNTLPAQVKAPAVVIIPRGRQNAFIKSVNGDSGFSIARTEGGSGPVTVDLMIFETGL
jgi:hypothetical protein